MGNICTRETKIIETKYAYPEKIETQTAATQTEDDKRFIFIKVVTPTEFVTSVDSPSSSDTNTGEKILRKVKGNSIVSPSGSKELFPIEITKTFKTYGNIFENFDYDPNFVTE